MFPARRGSGSKASRKGDGGRNEDTTGRAGPQAAGDRGGAPHHGVQVE